jgi:hypothetical protein
MMQHGKLLKHAARHATAEPCSRCLAAECSLASCHSTVLNVLTADARILPALHGEEGQAQL